MPGSARRRKRKSPANRPIGTFLLCRVRRTRHVGRRRRNEPAAERLRCRRHGRLAQLGERLPYKQEVGGSIPSPPIFESPPFQGFFRRSGHCGTARHGWLGQPRQSTAISSASQISRMRSPLSRPRRSTSVPIETLSTESRLTTEISGIGSAGGSRSTSVGIPRIVVVQGPISARRRRGIAASRESTTTGRRPISGSSHHQTSPRAGSAVTTSRRPPGRRRGLPTRRFRRAGVRRRPHTQRRTQLRVGEPSGRRALRRSVPHRQALSTPGARSRASRHRPSC